MSSIVRNGKGTSNLVVAGVLNYFTLKLTEEEALKNLVKSHENYPDLFPCVDYRDVQFWYNSFREGNFDLTQSPPDHDLIAKLPYNNVLDRIFNQTSVDDQKALRETCPRVENLIDSGERIYEKVVIILKIRSVLITTELINGEKDSIICIKKEIGCEVVEKDKRTPHEEDYILTGAKTFHEKISKINTKIKLLIMKYENQVNPEDHNRYIKEMSDQLNNLRAKLHVEVIKLDCMEANDIDLILTKLQPNALKSLDISNVSRLPILNVGDIPGLLDHWIHLTSFYTVARFDIELEALCHLEKMIIQLDAVNPRDVFKYRNKIIDSKQLDYHVFHIPEQARENFKNGLEPYTVIEIDDEIDLLDVLEKLSIPLPNPSAGYIKVSIEDNRIVLKKVLHEA